jgi:hypothetical protein
VIYKLFCFVGLRQALPFGKVLDGPKKQPAFLEAGCWIISFLIYYHAPPPAEVIIMTATIIIETTPAMTLLIVFFNMKDVCFVNIHPPF